MTRARATLHNKYNSLSKLDLNKNIFRFIDHNSSFKKLVNTLLLAGIIFGISYYVSKDWDIARLKEINFNIKYLAYSILLHSLHFFLVCKISHSLLIIKQPLSYISYLRIYFISQLGRYIPGKIWMVLGKIEALQRHNFSRMWITLASFYEILLMLVGASFISILGLPLISNSFFSDLGLFRYAILVAPFLGLVALQKCIPFILNLLPKLSKRFTGIITDKNPFTFIIVAKSLAGFMLSWVMQGIAFSFLIQSVFPQYELSIFFIISYTLAWIAGFLALFSPSGIGVRESIIILLLSTRMSAGEAALIAIVTRVWSTAIELSISSLVLIPRPFENRNTQ